MTQEQCLEALRLLIRQADVREIVLAQRVIDSFIDSHRETPGRTQALRILHQQLTSIRQKVTVSQGEFIDLMLP
jgi:hypothetical protein